MKPLPWSFSALNTFKTCGEQYRQKYIVKELKEQPNESQEWGTTAHKAFEDRQGLGVELAPLPPSLMEHEPYMKRLEAYGGIVFTEVAGALDKKLMPVNEVWSKDIWFRVVIDMLRVIRDGNNALMVDYKTGKQKDEEHLKQLKLYAIVIWHMFPKVDIVDARVYYTQTMFEKRYVFSRKEEDAFWGEFVPDLQQLREAFRTETFQKRPSGLCKGWCFVHTCEHWSAEKRKRR